jgi:blue copper oxidase
MHSIDRWQTRWTRRDFVRLALASAGVLAAGSVTVSTGLTAQGGGGGSGTVTRNPLYIPPKVFSINGVLNLDLTASPGSVDLGGGRQSKAWVYNGGLPNLPIFNGGLPGPTLLVRQGNTATIRLTNGLPSEPTITHWHGMLVTHANDGHPMEAINPGSTYDYSFPILNRAALNWYHPHPHMLTGEQVAMGLAGAFIVRDAEEDALGLPGKNDSYEAPLVIRDTSFDSSGNIAYKARTGGFEGTTPLVNGTLNPYLNVDTAVYRLRVLGGANARIFRLALSNGAPFYLIGNDGGLLVSRATVTQIDLAPGERLDLLVDFRGLTTGTKIMLRDLLAGWDLLEFNVARQVATTYTIPATLSTITALTNPVTTRNFSFDGMSKINGKLYDMNRIDFQVPFGQVEKWRFTTNGNAPHPVHVHGASFQVISRTGGRGKLFPWEAGWKDTVLLQDFETVEVLIRFDAYKGIYLLHCHKLEHEDMGMMSNFAVI